MTAEELGLGTLEWELLLDGSLDVNVNGKGQYPKRIRLSGIEECERLLDRLQHAVSYMKKSEGGPIDG